jgi:Uma2 family endonuclease
MFQDVDAITVPEFIAWAEWVEGRYELVDGHIVPHPDYFSTPQGFASPDNDHNAIVANIMRIVERQIAPPCRIYPSAGVEVAENKANTADAAVSCLDSRSDKVLRSPTVVFEVSSDRTRKNDTGRKVSQYTSIPSLIVYVFVDRKNRAITLYRPDRPPETYSDGSRPLTSDIILPFDEAFA